MSELIRKPIQRPKIALASGIVYSGDNGRLFCVHCAGMSAKFTGRDLSGHKVTAMTQADADHWKQVFGDDLECEGGCTKHLASAGVVYTPESAVEIFGMEVRGKCAS